MKIFFWGMMLLMIQLSIKSAEVSNSVSFLKEHGSCLLMQAIKGRNSIGVKECIDKGIDPNFHESYCKIDYILEASEKMYYDVGEFIQVAPDGRHIDQDHFSHMTPLIFATLLDEVKIVQLLLRAGARINELCCPQGMSALFFARTGAFPIFFNYGADLEICDAGGNTPLLLAAKYGYVSRCKYLLEGGAQVNARNKAHQTPLHLGLSYDVCHLLLEHGADVFARDINGKLPLEYADGRSGIHILDHMFALNLGASDYDCVKNMLAHKKLRHNLLDQAVKYGYMHVCKQALNNEPFPAAVLHKKKLLETVVRLGNLEICTELLGYLDFSQKSSCDSVLSAVRESVEMGKTKIFNVLFPQSKEMLLRNDDALLLLLQSLGIRLSKLSAIAEPIFEAIAVRNQSIVTFLLYLKHHESGLMRNLYRDKFFVPYLAPAYKSLKIIIDECLRLYDYPENVWHELPLVNPNAVDETHAYLVHRSQTIPQNELFSDELLPVDENVVSLHVDSSLEELANQFENSRADVYGIRKNAKRAKCCEIQ